MVSGRTLTGHTAPRWFARGLAAASLLLMSSAGAAAETRGYVFSMMHLAAYGDKANCPVGGSLGPADIKENIFVRQGYTREQAKALVAAGNGRVNNIKDDSGKRVEYVNRGRFEGKPANVANFPDTTPDPNLELVAGKRAYGFNLDGDVEPDSFEDPDSGEKGVDNVAWRVLGCFEMYDVRLPVRPYSEEYAWDTAMDAMPAWLMAVTGDDLGKDGPVTVTFDRSFNILMRDTRGGTLPGATFVIDPNPRNHSVFKGEIKNQVLTLLPNDAELHLQGESQFFHVLRLLSARVRLQMLPDGSLKGILGGYQPWLDYYNYLAVRGEDQSHVDLPGVYYAFKRLSDGGIDPVTGEGRISVAFWMEAVPAFHTTLTRRVADAVMTLGPAAGNEANLADAGK